MKIHSTHLVLALCATLPAVLLLKGRVSAEKATQASHGSASADPIERGRYLVQLGGCTDCHTPKQMTNQGPADDFERLFSGHPEGLVLPPPEKPSGPWGAATAGMTAWTGPWGVSYASNLTPDEETGLGRWTEAMFIQAMRTGRHEGAGRPILPPMPWQPLSKAEEGDLKAIFAYLKSLPAIKNRVPDPQPPAVAQVQPQ